MSNLHKQVLEELKIVCEKRRRLLETVPSTPPHLFLAVIRTTIESLAFQAKLKQHENNARTLFADVFEPVPHLDRLPISDSVMQIELKDNKRFVQKRSYTVPKHYKNAMDKILDL